MPNYRFKRSLFINDPDPMFEWSRATREEAIWPKQIDGKPVTQIDRNGQWWIDGCQVNRAWCEKIPELHLVGGA